MSPTPRYRLRSHLKHRIKKAEDQLAEDRQRLENAFEEYEATCIVMMTKSSEAEQRTAQKYVEEMDATDTQSIGRLEKLVEFMVNRGQLITGDVVEIADGPRFITAEVAGPATPDTPASFYDVNVWAAKNSVDTEYSEGYDKRMCVAREVMYSRGLPLVQPALGGKDSNSIEYLALLMQSCERAKPAFDQECARLAAAAASPELHLADLKKTARVTARAKAQHRGGYDGVCDIVRSTFECDTVQTIETLMEELVKSSKLDVARIKNGLHHCHDATSTSQYREVVVNVVHLASGLYCEIRITLRKLYRMEVKAASAHVRLIRSIASREESAIALHGSLRASDLPQVASGLTLKVDVLGAKVALDRLHGPISNSLSCKSCQLTVLSMVGLTGLKGKTLGETFLSKAIVNQLQWSLRSLHVAASGLSGVIPARLWTKMQVLEELVLASNHLSGDALPAHRPACAGHLQRIVLSANHLLAGTLPDWLPECPRLWDVQASDNKITGLLPSSLGGCQQLKTLLLSNNLLSGPIPESIGGCTRLHKLFLHHNKLSGHIPANLGNCSQLLHLHLHENALAGPIPQSLGGCFQLVELFVHKNGKLTMLDEDKGELRSRLPNTHIDGLPWNLF